MELLVLLVGALLVSIPVLFYRHGAKQHGGEWAWREKIPLAAGGAYRGSWITKLHHPGAPRVVRVASIVSMLLIVPAVFSLPALLLGLSQESKHGALGPAFVFGPTGLALAGAIFLAGRSLLKRDDGARRLALGVGLWSIAHNVAVASAVLVASIQGSEASLDWQYYGMEAAGPVVIAYIAVSLAHAALLIAAARAHETAPKDAPAVAARPEPVYAAS